jgi:hypothetical protein
MLSALIPSIRSYPAFHLVAKPVDQRYVQPSPLVLRPTPLKYFTPAADRDRPVSRTSSLIAITSGLDYTTISQNLRDDQRVSPAVYAELQLLRAKSLRGQCMKHAFASIMHDFPRYYPLYFRSKY